MSKAKTANDMTLPPCWKVRICIRHCCVIHIVSQIEPVVHMGQDGIKSVELEVIDGTQNGDTVGYIRWEDCSAITWRYAPLESSVAPKKNGSRGFRNNRNKDNIRRLDDNMGFV